MNKKIERIIKALHARYFADVTSNYIGTSVSKTNYHQLFTFSKPTSITSVWARNGTLDGTYASPRLSYIKDLDGNILYSPSWILPSSSGSTYTLPVSTKPMMGAYLVWNTNDSGFNFRILGSYLNGKEQRIK